MASIQKRPGKPNWIAYFRDASGRLRTKTTELRATAENKLAAQRYADGLEKVARGERTVAAMHALVDELAKELGIGGGRGPAVSVSGYLARWLEVKGAEVGAATLTFYGLVVRGFEKWLGDKAGGDLRALTRETVIEYRGHFIKTRAPRTVRQHLKTLRMIFNQARREGAISENPADLPAVKLPKSEGTRRPFTVQELRAVLSKCKGEWRGMVLFGFYSGQRLGDIAALLWEDLELKAGLWRFATRKTGRRQAIPLHTALRAYLAKLKGSRKGPVFPDAAAAMDRTQGRTALLSHQFAELLAAAGLRASGPAREATRAGRLGAIAAAYGVSRQCIAKWRKVGAGKGEPPPLDVPGEMPAWFERHHRGRVPAGIEGAAARHPEGMLPDLPPDLGRGGAGKRRDVSALSFHSLRHTATSLLSAAGVSRAVAMDLIGHDSEAMNRHYSHTGEGERRQAVDALPAL